jgi:Cu(I)/Ag(I) efflux system membrane fusion protein
MNAQRASVTRRRVIAYVAVLAVAVAAVVAFRRPLVAWFTGKDMGGMEGDATTLQVGPFTIKASLSPDPPREKGQSLVLEIRDSNGKSVEDATVDVVYDMPAMGAMAEMKGNAKVVHDGGGRYEARFDLPMRGSWTLRVEIRSPLGSVSQAFALAVGSAGLRLAGSGEVNSSPKATASVAPSAIQYPPIAFDALRSAMDAYDRVRAKLERDDTSGLATDTRAMADALRAVRGGLPPGRSDLGEAATASLEATDQLFAAGSVDDARRAFARVNQSFLPLVGADARLSAGWHVFECPMFEGHPRWMQRRDAPENPYMGSKMPSCGTETTWQPTAATSPPTTYSPGEIDHYTCSMHPSVNQAVPGTCPICGMNLIPVTKEQQQQGVVTIDEARRQLIGVRTEPVVRGPMRENFRAVGHVTYDESALADVTLKVHGWITKLYVNQTGQSVARGQTLFTVYSPELYNAEQDFLLGSAHAAAAARAADGQVSADPFGRADGDAGPSRGELLGRASRQRLHLLGLTDAQIDAIGANGKPSEELAIPSPASGFVIEKNVVEGASVDAGMRLYRIAALSKVWVEAEVYEADLTHVRVGQPATVTLDYVPGRAYQAKVAYIYPYLDPTTRTGRVRIEIGNTKLDLRPGMYASVELSSDLGQRVQVPAAAVVYTGPRRLVFVDLGGGRFKPTEVRVGAESGGMYEVLSGLSPGDLVATSGVFLIAAEARISTATKYWDTTSEATDAGPASMTEGMPGAPVAPKPKPATPHGAQAPPPSPSVSPAPTPSSSPPAIDYTCPMDPEVHSPKPGKCPKCGMDLEPRIKP